jgi:Flp pilus assembly protein TadD
MPQLRSEEACTILERALAADPYNPVLHAGVIVIYGRAGRIEQAVRQYELSMDYAPQYPPLHGSGGLAYELSGEMDKAIAAYRLCCKLTGDAPYPRSALSHALAVAGEVEEARQIAMEMAANGMLAPADTARAFAGLRDEEETLRWLETACDHGSLHLIVVAADHCFQWLRPNPRFQRILQRMNLANVHAAAQS